MLRSKLTTYTAQDGARPDQGALQFGMHDVAVQVFFGGGCKCRRTTHATLGATQTVDGLYEENGGISPDLHSPTMERRAHNCKAMQRTASVKFTMVATLAALLAGTRTAVARSTLRRIEVLATFV